MLFDFGEKKRYKLPTMNIDLLLKFSIHAKKEKEKPICSSSIKLLYNTVINRQKNGFISQKQHVPKSHNNYMKGVYKIYHYS